MSDDVIEGEAVEETMPVVRPPAPSTALVARDEISVAELVKQSDIIHEAMRHAMTADTHYGVIPGTKKPSLLKPGAEKLCVLFRLAPSYESDREWHPDGHLTVVSKCRLTHIPTGLFVAEGEGLCSTKESRYAWRKGERVCPECGEPQVRKGRPQNGRPGNWYCWRKEGGCGATWDLDSEQGRAFDGMETGRVANPDIADSYNTVLKMADKRALLAAILNGTAASDVFTQDMEDAPARGGSSAPTPAPEFDPATQLLDGAPRGQKVVQDGMKILVECEPRVEWPKVVAQAIRGHFGVEKAAQIPQDRYPEFAHRYANACAAVRQEFRADEMPPIEDAGIQRAFAWAFGGIAVNVTRKAGDDLPDF